MTIRYAILNAALPLSLLIAPTYAATKTTADYRITKAVALGIGERWDFVVFDPVGKRLYVAHGDHVTVVDEPDGKVIGSIGTFPGGTHGIAISIAIDLETRRLFSTCANKVLVVLDATNGKNIASIPIGSFSDGAAFDSVRKLIFSSNGDGTLSAIREKDAQTFVPGGMIKTVLGARTMAIDPKTGRIFIVGADIAKIDPPSKQGGRPHVT